MEDNSSFATKGKISPPIEATFASYHKRFFCCNTSPKINLTLSGSLPKKGKTSIMPILPAHFWVLLYSDRLKIIVIIINRPIASDEFHIN